MAIAEDEIIRELYNLILNPNTREWERSLLVTAKNGLEKEANNKNSKDQLGRLEAELRPLAIRNNLTPDVTDFYMKITNDPAVDISFDIDKHTIKEVAYQERAVFAGGCFWCMVEPFETKPGIISVLSGYTGGDVSRPNYDQVSARYTGHVEAVEIIFDTRLVKYEELVELYWQITDPTDALGQFQDRGSQYKPIIFVQNEEQRAVAEKSKKKLAESGKHKGPIVTEIKSARIFWPAENYHQEFYKKQVKRYKRIQQARQQFLFYQRIKNSFYFRKKHKTN